MTATTALDLTGYRMLTIPAYSVQPGDLLGDLHGTWNTATRNDDSTEGETSTRDIVLVPLDGSDPHTLGILAMEQVAVLRPAPTATATTDQAAAQTAVDALTQAIKLLNQVATDMNHRAATGTDTSAEVAGQIATFAQAAVDRADLALMIASNELKLAQRDPS